MTRGLVYVVIDDDCKLYVGSTTNFERRRCEHLARKTLFGEVLVDPHKTWTWKILESHDDIKKRDLLWLELLYQEQLDTVVNGYNRHYAIARDRQLVRDSRYEMRYGDPYKSRHLLAHGIETKVTEFKRWLRDRTRDKATVESS